MRTFVIGVGMTSFEKPGRREGWTYPVMAKEAIAGALADAGVDYGRIQQVYASFIEGGTCAGQHAAYTAGLTGVPVFNVNNACASGSSALFLARQAVASGQADCVLGVGFEQMAPGSLEVKSAKFPFSPFDVHEETLRKIVEVDQTPFALQVFGHAGNEHMERYGSTADHFAWVGWKNHKHSVNNPYAQFRTEYTLEEVKESAHIMGPLTKLQCSPTSDGSAAAVIANERFVEAHDLWDRAVEIVGQGMATDVQESFEPASAISVVGFGMTQLAARTAYDQAGVGPEDVQVIELHDCFSVNEILTYEGLGMAEVGHGHQLVEKQDTTYGGRWVVNPSGGLISKGHPIGATGFAQCAELTWQVRGDAGARQVEGATTALQHNLGLGGAAVVTIYARPTR